MVDKLQVDTLVQQINIADYLDDEKLQEIGRTVVEEYDLDEQSRAGWLEDVKKWTKLALQVHEMKNTPWPGAANVKMPLLSISAVQFNARAYPALVKGPNIVKGKICGPDADGSKLERAKRVSQHMSYQIFEEMDGWENDMDKLTLIIPIVGCCFKKSYRDVIEDKNRSDLVLAEDLVIDYYATTVETARRKTHKIYLTNNDIYERVKFKLFRDIDYGKNATIPQSTDSKLNNSTPPMEKSENVPKLFLEQHRFLDLDGDGYEEPYIVTVEHSTKEVARIVARYDLSTVDYDGDGETIRRIKPIEYFTKYGFIPNPDGSIYDVGFGLLLGSINSVLNTSVNQILDAGTLASKPSGFIGRGIRAKKGTLKVHPGEWVQVNATGPDLKNGIVPLPVAEPSQVLFQLLSLLWQSGKELSTNVDSLLGENPGQNQPATTTLAVMEEGLKVYNAIHKRLYTALTSEFKKLFRLNSRYLPSESYYEILGNDDAAADIIYKEDYNPKYVGVKPSADPSVMTELQAIYKARQLLELLPLGLNQEEVKRRNLEAQEHTNIDKLLEVPPPQPNFETQLEIDKFNHQKWFDEQTIEANKLKEVNAAIAAEAKALKDSVEAYAKAQESQIKDVQSQLDAIKLFVQLTKDQIEEEVTSETETPDSSENTQG